MFQRLDMGAQPVPTGVRFRVWAPEARSVEVQVIQEPILYAPLERREDGTWSGVVQGLGVGARYRYRLNGQQAFPDPYSTSQPDGVHGASEVTASDHNWHDAGWHGIRAEDLAIYECHVGTATDEGTFEALIGRLEYLKQLGVTALELMPVAEFSGRWNWGYDGVYPFAPTHNYGGAGGLKRLVDAAHDRGLAVILDVVYNHFGPEGNYLRQFAEAYFTSRYQTPWGDAINYDGPLSKWVRKLVIDNACYWIRDFHVDGLRLDATFKIHDQSSRHVLQDLTEAARATANGRSIALIAETSENEVRYLLPVDREGLGFDVVWADDFHHVLRRYLTGDHEGYYQDYQGTLAELARTVEQGFLYEGEWSKHLGGRRGTPARDQPAWQFQYCIQNHDQIGNRALGDRLNHVVDLERYKVASALLLLLPYTPLLFMGQEFTASSPFLYFTDHRPELGKLVTEGRRNEFRAYSAFGDPAEAEKIPDPQAESTFLQSKLKFGEASGSPGAQVVALYRELLRLRSSDPVLRRRDRRSMRAQAVTKDVLSVTFAGDPDQRVLIANFGEEVSLTRTRLGLTSQHQRILLNTADQRFGGPGAPAELRDQDLRLPARSAVFIA